MISSDSDHHIDLSRAEVQDEPISQGIIKSRYDSLQNWLPILA